MDFLHCIFCSLLFFIICGYVRSDVRPNIVWILVDDMSLHFGYQGKKLVTTPNVHRLAREGIVFSCAYATAPVCSALITGMYQAAIGAHNHRSSRGTEKIRLPEGMRTISMLMRKAGYYTTNADASGKPAGKEDYNFDYLEPETLRRRGLPWACRWAIVFRAVPTPRRQAAQCCEVV